MTDTNNDKWLNALAGKGKFPSDEADLNVVYKLGKKLRQKNQHDESSDKEGLSDLLKRLKDDGLLENNTQVSKHQYRNYAIAAALAIAVALPILLQHEPEIRPQYPVMRGMVETQKIIVEDPVEAAKEIQETLTNIGYKSQIYQFNGNLIMMFSIEKMDPEVVQILSEDNIILDKLGIQHIELIKR